MNFYVERVRKILWRGLPYVRILRMDYHIAAMEQELVYLKQQGDARLRNVERAGWTVDVLSVVCLLSVFYHYVIGPLSVGGKGFSNSKMSGVLAISHGDMLLDDKLAHSVEKACKKFLLIMNELGISLNMLCSMNVKDIIYYIDRGDDNEEVY